MVGRMVRKPVEDLAARWAVGMVDRTEHTTVGWMVDCSAVWTADNWVVTLADNLADLMVLQWAALKVDWLVAESAAVSAEWMVAMMVVPSVAWMVDSLADHLAQTKVGLWAAGSVAH